MRISTSIMSIEDRVRGVAELNYTNTSYVHVDVMDGKFVSNEQFNDISEIDEINLVSVKPLDVHLMVADPLKYIEKFYNMNIEFITLHVEVLSNIEQIIDKIHYMGYKVGLAIKPMTDMRELSIYLDMIDMILVMSVEPGYGGQKFIPKTVDRIKEIKKLIGNRNILVEVDGGINDTTISLVRDADIVVAGSYIVNSDDYNQRVDSLLMP